MLAAEAAIYIYLEIIENSEIQKKKTLEYSNQSRLMLRMRVDALI